MVTLFYFDYAFNLSDEELVARWSESVVWQYFSVVWRTTSPKLFCDVIQIGRFHTAIGDTALRQRSFTIQFK